MDLIKWFQAFFATAIVLGLGSTAPGPAHTSHPQGFRAGLHSAIVRLLGLELLDAFTLQHTTMT